jgi:hypothetical protein
MLATSKKIVAPRVAWRAKELTTSDPTAGHMLHGFCDDGFNVLTCFDLNHCWYLVGKLT